ncbi:hypothetical protein Plhal304r1_c017g0062921 [Plasmopara halstedii]
MRTQSFFHRNVGNPVSDYHLATEFSVMRDAAMRLDELVASSDANAIAKMGHQMVKAMESLWSEVRHVELKNFRVLWHKVIRFWDSMTLLSSFTISVTGLRSTSFVQSVRKKNH